MPHKNLPDIQSYSFIDAGPPLTDTDIAKAETELGMRMPDSLKVFYLHSNGGKLAGDHCVYVADDGVEWGVKFFFPLLENRFEGDSTLLRKSRFFVLEKKFIPPGSVCFAMDEGGWPYCMAQDGSIYIGYLEELDTPDGPMRLIAPSLEVFLNWMMTEEDAYDAD